ncbi:MAG: hypothetical protein ABR915_00140 [Thermoguttaceae bacterium]|jgi:hypothetical protein
MPTLFRCVVLGSFVWAGCAAGVAVAADPSPGKPAEKDWDPFPKTKILPDRYKLWHEEAAKGPHMKVVAATFFGGKGYEEFVAAGELADGTLVAIGNAWGPEFPVVPPSAVLGKGVHQGLKPDRDEKGRLVPVNDDPDCAGFWVLYEPGLKAIKKVVKFDWGVAQVRTGAVAPDGKSLVLTGRATPAFRALTEKAGPGQVQREPSSGGADVYVVKLDAATGTFAWAWIFEGAAAAPANLWLDKAGGVYFDLKGLRRIAADGKEVKLVNAKTGKWLGIDLEDGGAYFGGDRNTHTRREPWRQPYLYKYSATGERLWKLWEFDPKDMGSDHAGLEADSSVRDVDTMSNGNLVVAGWSDGANSVFWKQATDWKRNCPLGGFLWPWYPSGANSLGHLTVVNPKTLETILHSWWCAVLPSTNAKANRIKTARISRATVLRGDAVAFTGSAGTGLIQTPNSFWKPSGTNYDYGGETLGVWDKEFKNLMFSSYLPGCENVRVFATKKGLLCVSRSGGTDGKEPPTPSPSLKTLQPFGGATDGNIICLETP